MGETRHLDLISFLTLRVLNLVDLNVIPSV